MYLYTNKYRITMVILTCTPKIWNPYSTKWPFVSLHDKLGTHRLRVCG